MIRNEIRFLLILGLVLYLGFIMAGGVYGKIPPKIANTLMQEHSGVLNAKDRALIDRKLYQFKEKNKFQFGVVMVPTLDGSTIDSLSIRISNAYGIGSRNIGERGILLMIAVSEKRARFEISKDMEELITAYQLATIQNQFLNPKLLTFTQNSSASYDWREVIMSTLEAVDRQIKDNEKSKPSSIINNQYHNNNSSLYFWFFIIAIIGIPVLLYILFKTEGGIQYNNGKYSYPSNPPSSYNTGFGANMYYKNSVSKTSVNEKDYKKIRDKAKSKNSDPKPWNQPSSFYDENATYEIPKSAEEISSEITSKTMVVVPPINKNKIKIRKKVSEEEISEIPFIHK